jgi:hypothetical protein
MIERQKASMKVILPMILKLINAGKNGSVKGGRMVINKETLNSKAV